MAHPLMSFARVWKVVCYTILLFVAVTGNALAEVNAPIKIHQLPESPLIILDFKGGLTPRKSNKPHLLVTASGKGYIGSPYGTSKPLNFQLNQDEIQDILEFIINENHFFSFDPARVKEKIKEEINKPVAGSNNKIKKVFAVADAPTAVIRVVADGRDHSVEFYALSFAARKFPDIIELQQLLTIQKRLQKLISIIRAGGEQELAQYIETANSLVQKKWPGTPLIDIDDLQYVTLPKSGEKRLRFKVKDENPAVKLYRAVEIVHLPGEVAQYNIGEL